jgi:LmbE family N-acetylglucosaminyl deacetylase
MKKKIFKRKNIIISLVLIFIFICIITASNSTSLQNILMNDIYVKNFEPITKTDRILILAPHPDDEAISSAGLIQKALSVGAQVKIVYFTNGEYNQESFLIYEKRPLILKDQFLELGKIRMKEAISAMTGLGLKKDDLIFLGYPDFGTMDILVEYWDKNKPYSNILENISSVPYSECQSFNAPYIGQNILNDLENILKDFKPTKIIVSNPADLNRDHQAFYVFLRVALLDLKNDLETIPKIYTYLVHVRNWPLPKGLNKDYQLNIPENMEFIGDNWVNLNLNQDEINKKEYVVDKYVSQIKYNPEFLVSFVRKNELFSIYNDITVTKNNSSNSSININSNNINSNNMNNNNTNKVNTNRGNTQTTDLNNNKINDKQNFVNLKNNNPENNNEENIQYYIKDNYLFLDVGLKSKIDKDFGISIYLLSYSSKQDFSLMPKIHIVINFKGISIKDKFNFINNKDINYYYQGNNLIIKVPFNILNEPDYIMSYIRTHSTRLIFDKSMWQILKINN